MPRFIRQAMLALIALMALTTQAQVTTSAINGELTDAEGQSIVGANIIAVHQPTGTRYATTTNTKGSFLLNGLKTGGPYTLTVSYIGYKKVSVEDLTLQLGAPVSLKLTMDESATGLDEAVVSAVANRGNMRFERSGTLTSVSQKQIQELPTVTRQFDDLLNLTPQGSAACGAFAVGGGNFRQSSVTVDGAQFNNSFGLAQSSILPGGGQPISLDALEQVSVSSTPYDVRQSGFNGASINAVTRSGSNDFHATAYAYMTGNRLRGTHVGGQEKFSLDKGYSRTYGVSVGGPIVKDRLFFFVNGEYMDNVTAGPVARATGGDNGKYTDTNRRPTLDQLNSLSKYLNEHYGFQTGQWQGFDVSTPAYRLLARLDWNINDRHKLSVRFTHSESKENSDASNSRSIGSNQSTYIYGGSNTTYGSKSYYGMTSFAARYFKHYNFTSAAAELNSELSDRWSNVLRATYSFQDQPRSSEYGSQPTLELVMNNGQGIYPAWAFTGSDLFTVGNLVQAKNAVVTEELTGKLGRHDLILGLQYELTKAANGYTQAGAGYFAFEVTPEQAAAGDWASVFGQAPRVFGIGYGNNADHSQYTSHLSLHNFSLYAQDNFKVSDRFRLSYGVRFELPLYPALHPSQSAVRDFPWSSSFTPTPAPPAYNEGFYAIDFGGQHYRTDQTPKAKISVSPRVGFNWDVLGNQRLVLRGGTGLFVGRLPFAWLVSAVLNDGLGQTTTVLRSAKGHTMPQYANGSYFTTDRGEMLQAIGATSAVSIPSGPTILSRNLEMPMTWKSSLAADIVLPGGVDFTLEGIYSRELNPVVVSNRDIYWDGTSTVTLNPYDTRRSYAYYDANHSCYVLENAGRKAYYWSLTASLRKQWGFGLALSAAYTHSAARCYSEGIGDQVSGAYNYYRNSVNGVNDNELGYATYVQPNRVLFTAAYTINEGRHTNSVLSLMYEGGEVGVLSAAQFTRYSYIFSSNVNNDALAQGNLIRVPASRAELDEWNFVDNGTYTDESGQKQTYTANQQRDDFWSYINQDNYLKGRKGKYAERGGARMPWHHQLNFKFAQNIFFEQANGRKHTLTLGCDITNLPNLLCHKWGAYKEVTSNALLNYAGGNYTYNLVNGSRHLTTTQNYSSVLSTFQVLFNVRYTF